MPRVTKLTQRRHKNPPLNDENAVMWGFDCPKGFAPFGPKDEDKEIAERCMIYYKAGDTCWSFWAIADTELI